MTTENHPYPVYLDCDTGIDDALAIAYLSAHPDVDLVGVGIVSGNTDVDHGARNTLDLLALLDDMATPVAKGARRFRAAEFHGGAPHVHGDNGIGGVLLPLAPRDADPRHAAELLIAAARQNPGELRVLAIGPLTNLAIALDLEPELTRLVRDVTIMGGAALAAGNISAVAEANIANDPEAAQRVLEAAWDITLVPLDATMEQLLEESHLETLRGHGTPIAGALGAMLDTYLDFYASRFGRRLAVLHDPLAAAVLTGEVTAVRATRVPVTVDTGHGPGRGQTVADLRGLTHPEPSDHPAGVRIVLSVQETFVDLLLERLTS